MNDRSKITLWFIILFIILILCSWYHSDRIVKESGATKVQVKTTNNVGVDEGSEGKKESSLLTLFDIVKKEDRKIEISGKFKDENQMKIFGEIFKSGGTVQYLSNDFNKSREIMDNTLSVVKDLAPTFNNNFLSGSIKYSNDGKIVIDGIVKESNSKELVKEILKKQTTPYITNIKVLEKKESFIRIEKGEDGKYSLEANISSQGEKEKIKAIMKRLSLGDLQRLDESFYIDDMTKKAFWMNTVNKLTPMLDKDFIKGRVQYINGEIRVDGSVTSKTTKDEIEKILKNSGMKYSINIEIVEETSKSSLSKEVNNSSKMIESNVSVQQKSTTKTKSENDKNASISDSNSNKMIESNVSLQQKSTTETKSENDKNVSISDSNSNKMIESNVSVQQKSTIETKSENDKNASISDSNSNKMIESNVSVQQKSTTETKSENDKNASISDSNSNKMIESNVSVQQKSTIETKSENDKNASMQQIQIISHKKSFVEIKKGEDGKYSIEANISSEKEQDDIKSIFNSLNLLSDNIEETFVVDDMTQKTLCIDEVSKLIIILDRDFTKGRVHCIGSKIVVEGSVSSDDIKNRVEDIFRNGNLEYIIDIEVVEQTAQNGLSKVNNMEVNDINGSSNNDVTNRDVDDGIITYDYEKIYSQMSPKQREMSKKIESNISALLKVENITFKTGSAKLTKKGKDVVKKIAKILNDYPGVYIEIAGHTDDIGDDKANLNLSKRRVESVKAELISLGINGERLSAVGYGESQPIVPNDSKINRERNRRVEFHIIKIEEVK